ncbi:putative digestive organ expansion factor, predicted [Helianthus annuus]|nr:putative digestive organ expansion factor, predicted [Helianthus annuus]KAJ0599572.1 putative digestive organ expansion factor, predicted [Helianthus annuus]KAJ0607111.1 putative digestive organ expansion factor, predicted [Helianthus annuus]KAJ0767164.1 putative digestive organ expansion factor, predicted [Helianthus annuus]
MAKPKYANKRAFSRSTTNEVSKKNMNKRARRNRHAEQEPAPDHPSSSTDSGASIDELSNAASEDEQEEVHVYKEPTMYDNLLKTLGSASESIANAYKRRQRDEEGKSDTDEDIENDVESLSGSEEDEDESENDIESDALDTNDVQGEDEIEYEDGDGDEDGDEDEDGDGDDDDDDDGEEEVAGNKSEGSSSFSAHLDYELSKEEIENLPTKKMKYKHRLEAANCKWAATRELNLEDSYSKSPYGLNMKLYDHWLNSYTASGGQDLHSSRQRSFFSLCNSYRDILHHNKKPFYLKGREEDSNIMDAYLLHSLNHIFKTRDLVTKNDKTMAKQKESKGEEVLNSEKFVDQGFTRPKVLIILPYRSIAFRVINRLIQLTPEGHKVNVDHVDRFSDEYGSGQSDDQEDEDVRTKSWKKSKPLDYQALLGANNNDRFMIGIKFTKKTVKLYSDFYTSDMIVASPLGLIDKIETAVVEKEKDVDYLSSIEVLIIDHADVILMQNWDHVPPVIEQLNHIPSKQHGTDIMRIRPWYLDGQARFYRQSIVLASHVHPDINNLFNNYCLNYEGKVNLLREHEGVLPKVLLQVTQIYERIDDTELSAPDARLEYFKKKVFPKIKDSVQGGIMILINSVLELVGVRKFLKSQDASFCVCDEDTERPDISRARAWFFQGKKKIMLYTERAHFYYRYKIRGIQNLIIYSIPERKEFYPEIVNMLDGSHSMNCTVLFSRSDRLRLERVVGTGPAKRMVTSDKQRQ